MLTDVDVRGFKPEAALYRKADAHGLCVEITPNGAKLWRMRYRFNGSARMLSLGAYPGVTLKDARAARDAARKLLASGVDPSADRKAERSADRATFGAIKAEWLAAMPATRAPSTKAKANWLLSLASPLDARPIATVTPADVLAVLRIIETSSENGHAMAETVRRVRSRIRAVFALAIATGRASSDPTSSISAGLRERPATRHHAALTAPDDVARLLRAIHAFSGQPTTAAALKLSPMLLARPGELRAMTWDELDLDSATWELPPERMKMRRAHVVPLASQAVCILRDLQPLTGRGRYVFPSLRTPERCLSENTVNIALRTLGFSKEQMTAHGFRAMARTLLDEVLGVRPDIVEHQLAHEVRDPLGRAYNRTSHLPARKEMMQQWADYLDVLRTDANVTPIRKNAGASR